MNGDHAVYYTTLGWPVLPLAYLKDDGSCSCGKRECPSPGKHPDGALVPTGLKEATTDPNVVRGWWTRSPNANVGVRSGVAFDVLDLDGDDGKAWLVEMEAQHGALDGHLRQRSGKGGLHIFVQPTGLGNTTGIDHRKVDYRGEGGYIIVAPSVTVGAYEFLSDPATPLLPAPEWLVAKMTERKKRETLVDAGAIRVGGRNSALTSIGGFLRNKGFGGEDIEAVLQAVNENVMEEPLPDTEVRSVARSVAGMEVRPDPYKAGDTGNAEYFADVRGDLVRYDHSRAKWYIFNDESGSWRVDDDGGITRMWNRAARQRLEWAASLPEPEDRAREARNALSMEKAKARIEAGLGLASTMDPIRTNGQSWDPDPLLLGCTNGVIDLRTGRLREGRPEDMVTMSTGVMFDPQAKAPRWEQFLREVFSDDEALIGWLQKAVGYSATGLASEEVILLNYGVGANGKSRFMSAIGKALGSYSHTMEMRALDSSYSGSVPNDVMALRGKRYVMASEARAGTQLNEAKLKMLTGSEEVTARALYREYESFRPSLTLWIGVNHRPEVKDDSNGIWRRLKLVPFEVVFDTSGDPLWKGLRADPDLERKLDAELPGILRWIVEGAVRWWDEGLRPFPDRIAEATADYRAEQDFLTGFVRDCITFGGDDKVRSADVYNAFHKWWVDEGNRSSDAPNATKFGTAFKDRMKVVCPGFVADRDKVGRFYKGFNIETGDADEEDLGF